MCHGLEPRTWTDLTLFRSGDSDTPRRYRNPDRIKIRHIQPIILGFYMLTDGLNNISKHYNKCENMSEEWSPANPLFDNVSPGI